MNKFWEISPALAFFVVVAILVNNFLDYRVRQKLIDKGMVDENVKYLSRFESGFMTSLKWGMVLIGIGLALVISQLAPDSISRDMTIGLMFLFAGIGFLVYYGIASHLKHKNGDGLSPKL